VFLLRTDTRKSQLEPGLSLDDTPGYGCCPAGALPPLFVAVSGDLFTSELLLHDGVCVNVVMKFMCGVPSSVQVCVDAPPATAGTASTPA